MDMNFIGKSGLRVSNICMGTMTFGTFASEKESLKIMDYAYDNGINFYDTAEIYPVPLSKETSGLTEKIMAKWLKTKPRDSVILASKVAGASNSWFVPPIRHGLTALDKFHIKSALEASLKRLQTDYIDLYQTHWNDKIVPIEESLRALEDLIKEGKVRYLGGSNESAYSLTKTNYTAKYLNIPRFQSVQNNCSLLSRKFLDSMAELCKEEQISLLPYSPLAGGVLSAKYNKEGKDRGRFDSYTKHQNPRVRAQVDKFCNKNNLKLVEEYKKIADKYDISLINLSFSWLLNFDFIPSIIIGVRKIEQLKEILSNKNFNLDNKILNECKKVYNKFPYDIF